MAEIAQGLGGAVSGAATGAKIGSMFGPGVGTAIGAGAGALIGGVAGLFAGGAKKKAAEKLAAEVDAMIAELGLPPETAGPLLLEKLQQNGLYSAEVEQAINLEASKVAQIKEDPSLRNAQMKGLELISGRAEMGLTPEDRAELAKVMDQTAQDTRGRDESIIQNMQARGQGGGGAELAARLASSQGSANRATTSGNEIAAAASRNALEAAGQMGQLGSQIRSQDFSTAKDVASAEDIRNKLLYENSTALQQRNIDRAQRSNDQNLNRQQYVGDSNTQMANAETARQNTARADDYASRRANTQMRINAKTDNAASIDAAKQGDKTQFSNMMSGIGVGVDTTKSALEKLAGPATATTKLSARDTIDDDGKAHRKWKDG